MATYEELFTLRSDDTLRNRITVAVVVAAQEMFEQGTPTADEVNWASAVLSNPKPEGGKALLAILAANKSATLTQIGNVTDVTIQTLTDEIAPKLVTAYAAQLTLGG